MIFRIMGCITLLLILGLEACVEGPTNDKQAIEDVMNGQAAAWNKGDLDGYMKGYWMSDSLVFTGGKSISMGWEPALNRYKQSYPDKETMGRLEFSKTRTKFHSGESAYSYGKWTLYRSADTLSGRFTLVWKKVNGAWFIVADHSS